MIANTKPKYFIDEYSNKIYRELIDRLSKFDMTIEFDSSLELSEDYPFNNIYDFKEYLFANISRYEKIYAEYAKLGYEPRIFNFATIRYKNFAIELFGKIDIERITDILCTTTFDRVNPDVTKTRKLIGNTTDVIPNGNIFEYLTKDKLESRKYYIDLQ